jgi:hypothetical protein
VAAVAVTALLLSSAVIQPWNEPDPVSLSVSRSSVGGNSTLLVNYTIVGSRYSDPVNIVMIPLERYESGPVYIFADKERYSLQEYARVLGLYDHLKAEMSNLGLDRSVSLVDRQGVDDVLNGSPSVLIIVNSTVDWSEQRSNMLSWVEGGGLIFGIGMDALPFISNGTGNEDGAGYRIGYEPLDYDGGTGVSASAAAAALDLRYSSPRYGMRLDDVEKYGQAIGFLYSRQIELTSAALIHRGNGSIVLFSDYIAQPFTTSMEDTVSQDVAYMLASGLPWESGPLWSIRVNGSTETVSGSVIVDLPLTNLVSCFAFSLADHQHRNRLLIVR